MQRQNPSIAYQTLVGSTRNMSKGSSLDLEDVVRHWTGRDTSLGRMYSSHGVPVKASTYCCGENLAVTIAQRQRAEGFR